MYSINLAYINSSVLGTLRYTDDTTGHMFMFINEQQKNRTTAGNNNKYQNRLGQQWKYMQRITPTHTQQCRPILNIVFMLHKRDLLVLQYNLCYTVIWSSFWASSVLFNLHQKSLKQVILSIQQKKAKCIFHKKTPV